MNKNRSIQIHSGRGCCGNHLRWLLLMDNKFTIFHAATIEEKQQYILNEVYPESRNCRNWLLYEFKFRFALNSDIVFTHTGWHGKWERNSGLWQHPYNLFLYSTNTELIYNLYNKFFVNKWSETLEQFAAEAERERQEAILCAQKYTGIIIDTVDLYQPILNQELYNRIINFCGLDNNYDACNIIHQQWYRRHQASGPCTDPGPLLIPYVGEHY